MPSQPPRTSILRFFVYLGIYFFIIIAALFMIKDEAIRMIGGKVGSEILGTRVEIGQFHWNLVAQKVVVRNLIIYHPDGFDEGHFIDIPQIIVQYDMIALLRGNVHMPLVLLDLREMNVIRSKEGKLNVDALKVLHPEKKEKFQMPEFQIDDLKLNIGKVIFTDSYKKAVPQILVYDLNIKNKSFKNIDNVPKLVTVVLAQALKPTAIQSAGLYAATALAGAAFLPAAVLGIIVASDASTAEFGVNAAKAFDAAIKFVRAKGRLIRSDKDKGMIEANIQGVDIKIKVEKVSLFKSRMTVSGRKYMLAKKEFAAGILYQIGEGL